MKMVLAFALPLLHPTSQGTVEAVNTNPLNAPRIDGHYLQTADDMERLLKNDIALLWLMIAH